LKDDNSIALLELKESSSEFTMDFDIVFNGCIGAIDELADQMRSLINIPEPGNYFSQKNLYNLKVQAI
jgi:hypothetical protein